MKTFAGTLILALTLFASSSARAANNPLELVLCEDRVTFTTLTNISMAIVLRNIGKTNLSPFRLLEDLSVVIDGHEYKRDPNRSLLYSGLRWVQPKVGWHERISLSDFVVPPILLSSGRHTIALRDDGAESNAQTIFIEPQK
jgi:hypothetical protein